MPWAPALSPAIYFFYLHQARDRHNRARPVHVEESKLRDMPRIGWHWLPKCSALPPRRGESRGTAPALAFTAGLQDGLQSAQCRGVFKAHPDMTENSSSSFRSQVKIEHEWPGNMIHIIKMHSRICAHILATADPCSFQDVLTK